MNNPSIDEVLNKAFFLACFILNDRETAIRTVEEATARLNVTTAAQGKRLYYKPTSSSWINSENAGRYRNKVLFSELHILQRLIYIASEPCEQRKEQSFVASDDAEQEMLIHFIKHLVRITTRRNSFYVTLGINRLLYNYSTAETMDAYNAVIQDPGRVKDDYYYRSRKGVLMQELKKRFGSFLEVVRGPRGEERFHASGQQGRLTDLVNECLSFFTPWDTRCLVPVGVNPIVDGIADLASRGKQEEDKIEVDRIHAVLHPDCYGRLVKLLGFDPPEHRLEVPHFFISKDTNNNGESPRGGGRHPSSLSHNELDEIKGHLDDQSARRKRVVAGMLRILVDGKEHARLAPSRSGSTQLLLDDDAELIEVRSLVIGDDLLLASHLFTDRETSNNNAEPEVTSIVLEGGQKLAITVSLAADAANTVVDVAYRETNLLRAATLYLRQITSSSDGERPARRHWNTARVAAFALSFTFLVLSVFGLVQFMRHRNSEPAQPETAMDNRDANKPGEGTSTAVADKGTASVNAAEVEPVASGPTDKNEGKQSSVDPKTAVQLPVRETARANESDQQQLSPKEPRKRETVSRTPESDETHPTMPAPTAQKLDRPDALETTRSLPNATAVVRLSDVRKIYVEVTGDAALGVNVHQTLLARLSESHRFITARSRDDADALLRVTLKIADVGKDEISASVVLINARGETIWHGEDAGVYTGSTENVAADLVRELLNDARELDERH